MRDRDLDAKIHIFKKGNLLKNSDGEKCIVYSTLKGPKAIHSFNADFGTDIIQEVGKSGWKLVEVLGEKYHEGLTNETVKKLIKGIKNVSPVYTAKKRGTKEVVKISLSENYFTDKDEYKWIKKDGQLIWWHPQNKKKPKIERGEGNSKGYPIDKVIVKYDYDRKSWCIAKNQSKRVIMNSRAATPEEVQLLGDDRDELEVRFKKEKK